MKNGTAHVQCSCKHEFQDKEYNGLRVANSTQEKATDHTTIVCCTVCGKTQEVKDSQVK